MKDASATTRQPGFWWRVLGMGAGLLALVLHAVLLFANPYNSAIEVGTYAVFGFLSLFALLAVWASWRSKPLWLAVAFLGAFIPMGFIFLFTANVFRLIGIANILYLVAGVGLSWHKSPRYPPVRM
jgi:hypothetical protein